MKNKIIKIIENSILIKHNILKEKKILLTLIEIIKEIIYCLKNNGKILIAGNGGSAADSQHLAAEFIVKFSIERISLPAIALTTDTSILTSIGNDYSFDNIFSRQIEALGNKKDIFIAISTSGNSKNILNAIEVAKQKELLTIGLTGKNGGKMKELCDKCICIPSNDTPRIQENHILIGHIICEMVEKKMFGK